MRLLIGIGRFKEMSYIIGLLMQHDEFESLLSYKGTEKVTKIYTIISHSHTVLVIEATCTA